MKLGRLIELLKEIDPAKVVANGFGMARSYRGYYEDLAFEPAHNTTIGAMLAHAEDAMSREFEGYKGGWYKATPETRCWIADWGETVDSPIQLYNLTKWRDRPRLSLRTANADEIRSIGRQILAQHLEGEADSAKQLAAAVSARSGIESALAEAGRKIRENDQQLKQAYWGLIDLMGQGIKTIKIGSYVLQGTSDRDGVMIKVIDLELPSPQQRGPR